MCPESIPAGQLRESLLAQKGTGRPCGCGSARTAVGGCLVMSRGLGLVGRKGRGDANARLELGVT